MVFVLSGYASCFADEFPCLPVAMQCSWRIPGGTSQVPGALWGCVGSLCRAIPVTRGRLRWELTFLHADSDLLNKALFLTEMLMQFVSKAGAFCKAVCAGELCSVAEAP